ncbi:unnamed protein product [Aureobasidium vineae]|uniref:Uncharacterized protein n=1 Tax=Aureobasidium vineae TaxID=2773715 RepID=A0A9N8JMY5_9PEZI|nr:unnamed protein product [Aureobasidium vineae]
MEKAPEVYLNPLSRIRVKISTIEHKDVTPDLTWWYDRAYISRRPWPRGTKYLAMIIDKDIPRYWWRQLAVDLDKVVWMQYRDGEEFTIRITSREAWEQVMKFRREYLAERNQPDHHKELGLDILLSPLERPQRHKKKEGPSPRRLDPKHIARPRRVVRAPVVDSNAYQKRPTKIPSPTSGSTRKYEHWRVRSDRNL